MPAVYTPGCIRVALNFVGGNEPIANVLHVRVIGGGAVTPADVQAAATDMSNWVVAEAQNWQSNQLMLANVTATDESQGAGAQFITAPGTAEYGDMNSPILPGNVTFAVKFGTGHVGRSYRGRMYWCGLMEASVNGNIVDASLADAIVAACETIPTYLASDNLEHVVVSTIENGAPRAVGLANLVTSYGYTDLIVDSQRGRLH